jgi:hypothetical protein
MLARKRAVRLIRVDDAGRVGERGARQMVIGDEDPHAEAVRFRDAFVARDAVVHRDQKIRRTAGMDAAHDLGRETVTVLEAVRHEVIDVAAERPQRTDAHGARRRAIRVVVSDDDQLCTRFDRVGEYPCHLASVVQVVRAQQPLDRIVELQCVGDAARRVNACEQRMASAGHETLGDRAVGVAEDDGRERAHP